MMRWIAVAAMMVAVVAGGAAGWLAPVEAQTGVEHPIWRAAGIVPFPRAVEAPPLHLLSLIHI